MSDGLRLISAVIAAGAAATLTALDPSIFLDREREVYDFVRAHHRSYRELPQLETVQQETGVRLPVAPEPLAFYVNLVQDRAMYNELAGHFANLRETLSRRDMTGAASLVAQMSRASRRNQRGGHEVMQMDEAMGLVLNRLSNTRGSDGITGIETGWANFDAQTGGWQDSDLVTFLGRPSMGKCMDPETPVLMHGGDIRKIKDVVAGDLLMGPDSRPRTVMSTTSGRDPMYRIIPRFGESWVCNGAHILVCAADTTIDKLHVAGSVHYYSVDTFLALPSRVQRKLRLIRAGVEMPYEETEVSPYYVGLWLGDGCVVNGRISTTDPEIVAAIADEAARFGLEVIQCEKRPGFCPVYAVVGKKGRDNPINSYVKDQCYSHKEKRIPGTLLRNSREVRLQLLAGIVDTDGYLHPANAFEITTKYSGLRDDLLYLARSLGFGATYLPKVVDGRTYFTVRLRGDTHLVPTRLPRKQAVQRKIRGNPLHSSFTVESLGEGDYVGVCLDGDHLYLLGDFTVTHNTYILLKQAKAAHSAGRNVLFVTTEMGTEQIARRYASIELGLDPRRLKLNQISTYNERRIRALYEQMAGAERFKLFSVGMNSRVSAIEAFCQEFGPDVVFIDGVYLLKPSAGDSKAKRMDKIAEVFDELKGLTLELERPIIVTSQLNRQAGEHGKSASLETASYTDAVATHSSVVVAIKHGPTDDPWKSRYLEFLKGREGEFGEFAINFKFAPLDMDEFTPAQAQAQQQTPPDLDWMA